MASLFIRSEVDGQGWKVWPIAEPIPPGRVREAASYFFELHDYELAQEVDLYIDDVPAEALRSQKPDMARWRWTPGFHAGSVEIVLRLPGSACQRFEVTTDPDLRKLTRDDFDSMVREILEDTFALFSLSSFRKGIAQQRAGRPPPLARLQFLHSRVEAILKIVGEINRSPRSFLRAEQTTIPFHRARRVTGQEVVRSFRTGAVLKETRNPSRLPSSLGGRLPAELIVKRQRASSDITEHRQIKACLGSWAAWLGDVSEVLESAARRADRDSASSLLSWSVRSRRIARKLRAGLDSEFFKEIGVEAPSLRLSPLFRSAPAYRKFYRLWQDMNLGLAALFGDFLQMPLAKTYELYELWCFLRLLRAAVDEYGEDGVDLSELFTSDATGGLTLFSGAVSVVIGNGLAVSFQRRYREYWNETHGAGSFSRTMVPDVVLAHAQTNATRSVIVLDSKYRIDGGLNEALGSIHTYRDALVRENSDGGITGIVRAAYLLTPHVPQFGEDYKDAAIPGRLFHPGYREKFRFGAITLRPGMRSDEIRSALRMIVADSIGQV
ncbi:DUF2357 domain-containing protein [Stenotrophomonas maltophilia]|nr:DUF2357 domain-containing protein [Stenotrophomonas maltophilia]